MFILGFSFIGDLVLSLSILKEFLPQNKLNLSAKVTIGFPTGGGTFSLMVIFIILLGFKHIKNWMFIASVIFFLQVVMSILRIDMDETPGFLLVKGKEKSAENVLNKIANINESDIHVVINNENLKRNESGGLKGNKLKQLFSKKYCKTTILFSVIYFSMYFGSFSLLLFMPRLLKQFEIVTK